MNYLSTLLLKISKKHLVSKITAAALLLYSQLGTAQNLYDFSKIIDLSNSLNSSRLKVPGDTSWHKIELGSTFNQGTFSGNWTGGGVSSAGIGSFFNALFENKKGKNAWRSDLQTQYGFLKNKGQQNRKSQDRIFFDTKYSRDLDVKWTLFANLNFQSQFSRGYNYPAEEDSIKITRKVSRFFAPAYLTQSIGLEYKPAPYFFVDFAPGAFRQTIVWDTNLYVNTPDQKNYGVPIGKRIRYELALMQIVANYNRDITKQMNLKFRYQLYSSILDPSQIDNRLDASLTAKVNKFFNVNLSAIVVYDDDQSSRVQLAQGLNVGFLYAF
ncbi:DUF3078 domain-containing protein [Dyadobacter psychrotolerans]|uniref:DUF3078 domain-containing protein n=1 Tax=Dyadobacter psychrotolerans TaxID=2541721 RepID=A0A4R5DC24_9BACT|nr:DUF3078 domain-containing protein [Dyadobacter psychrotolerans]TDE11266.1 DUF3078 domain-containing protein [Dyadobacter psychrotolerans]